MVFHSQHFFFIYLCISTPSMSKTVKLTWSNGYLEVIFHALDVFSITFATAYVESRKGAVLPASAMYMHYPRCETLPNNGQKQLKWYNFFRLSNSLFCTIKSICCFDTKSHSIPIKSNAIDNQRFTFNWPAVITLIVNTIWCVRLKATGT